jgi:transposase
MANDFVPMSSRCWRQHWRPATLSCSTICAATKPPIAEAITARQAQLIYLPPYSPDLNPIEQAFAKYKALLRKAAERTVDGLWHTIGRIADLFLPAECRNFFKTAGYAT